MSVKERRKDLEPSKKAWRKALKRDGLPTDTPKPQVFQKPLCYHKVLRKVIDDDFGYVCDECHAFVEIVGSFMYSPEQYVSKATKVIAHLIEHDEDAAAEAKKFSEANSVPVVDETKPKE